MYALYIPSVPNAHECREHFEYHWMAGHQLYKLRFKILYCTQITKYFLSHPVLLTGSAILWSFPPMVNVHCIHDHSCMSDIYILGVLWVGFVEDLF